MGVERKGVRRTCHGRSGPFGEQHTENEAHRFKRVSYSKQMAWVHVLKHHKKPPLCPRCGAVSYHGESSLYCKGGSTHPCPTKLEESSLPSLSLSSPLPSPPLSLTLLYDSVLNPLDGARPDTPVLRWAVP